MFNNPSGDQVALDVAARGSLVKAWAGTVAFAGATATLASSAFGMVADWWNAGEDDEDWSPREAEAAPQEAKQDALFQALQAAEARVSVRREVEAEVGDQRAREAQLLQEALAAGAEAARAAVEAQAAAHTAAAAAVAAAAAAAAVTVAASSRCNSGRSRPANEAARSPERLPRSSRSSPAEERQRDVKRRSRSRSGSPRSRSRSPSGARRRVAELPLFEPPLPPGADEEPFRLSTELPVQIEQ